MNNYKNILNKNNLKVNKITIKGNITIVDTPLGLFVLKKNSNIDIYNYLLSRGFNYFPKIIDYDNDYILMEYIEVIIYPEEEKAKDFMKLLALLHSKTSYFKNIKDDNKNLYEELKNRIKDLDFYYNNMFNILESKEYNSPSEFLLMKNASIIFSAINFCNYKLDEWYEKYKNNNKKRVCTLYNNIDLNHVLKSKNGIYLTSFNNTIINSPIYDLYNFYNKYNCFDFDSLLKYYESFFPLNEEEKALFLILISIPDKIIIDNSIINIRNIRKSIDKAYSVLNLLNSKKEETTGTHQEEDN